MMDHPPFIIHCGDVIEVLRGMAAQSVHCVVTSPPYWGLRDYGIEPSIWSGKNGRTDGRTEQESCEHDFQETVNPGGNGDGKSFRRDKLAGTQRGERRQPGTCTKCGAWCGCLGLEPTVEMYVRHMVEIFREVWRVLRDDGTLWLNMGDCYASAQAAVEDQQGKRRGRRVRDKWLHAHGALVPMMQPNRMPQAGLKPKDLIGMPWRVAFALQEDGWYLRRDNIWNKTNCMPESVTDRTTTSHEYIFHFSKSEQYFYDAEAIKEPVTGGAHARGNGINPKARIPQEGRYKNKQNVSFSGAVAGLVSRKNKRSVWTVSTHPFPEAHFATFPPKLIEPCILAGTSEKGCCSWCGAPYRRVVRRQAITVTAQKAHGKYVDAEHQNGQLRIQQKRELLRKATGCHDDYFPPTETIGWRRSCKCQLPASIEPCVVLDPFSGAGTTGVVAVRHGRRYVGCERGPQYVDMSIRRIKKECEVVSK